MKRTILITLVQLLIPALVRWLTGLGAADFGKIKTWAETAELQRQAAPGEIKAEWVRELIRQTWPNLAAWAVNLLNELAVAWLNKITAKP